MKNSEQPAMPIVNSDGFCTSFCNLQGPEVGAIGLTKREYAAIMAMQGILSGKLSDGYDPSPVSSAKEAIAAADALLAELDGQQENKMRATAMFAMLKRLQKMHQLLPDEIVADLDVLIDKIKNDQH